MLGVKSFHESFYGTPTPSETGRRGKKRQQKAKEEPENEIAVVGIHYRSFDDDSMATFVNSPAAQVPWNGDESLMIDRYDVRHLLQDLSGIRRRRRPPSPALDASKEELDYERYRDLEGLENPSPAAEDVAYNHENDPGGQYQRVGFNYSNGGDQAARGESGDRSTEETAFSPPFSVPEHLLSKLPSTLKVHQIMAGTAKFVIEHGGQAEIVLRVKQASNPTFGFLMPDHYHHEYFRFLVDNPQLVGIGLSTTEPVAAAVEVITEEAEGGLSLLGTAYGDSDDDEDEDVGTGVKPVQADVENTEGVSKADHVSDERSGGSEHAVDSELQTAVISENGTRDPSDSADAAGSVETLEKENQGGGDEEPSRNGNEEAVVAQIEPLPPGTETSEPMEVDVGVSDVQAEDSQQDLPPYKEPPLQQRRIIDKMVEFISRNGKEFEAIVRERDKKDGRFQFLLPWNEYYPYFSRSLETARQAIGSSLSSANEAPPTPETEVPTSRVHSDYKQKFDHFLKGVPYFDEFSPADQVSMHEVEDDKPETSYDELGVMGFDAVMAAVRAATRGFSRAADGSEGSAPQSKSPGRVESPPVGSDDAVLAAIRAATGAARRSRAEEPSGGVKGELAPARGLARPSGAADQLSLQAMEKVEEEKRQSSNSGTQPLDLGLPVAEGDAVEVGKKVAKAAALAAGQEGDSTDAILSPAGKKKAERLKKAKLFAAMLKEGKGALLQSGQGSGSHAVSGTPSVEKSSQPVVSMDVNPKEVLAQETNIAQEATRSAEEDTGKGILESKEQAEDAVVVRDDGEDDKGITREGRKEEKSKAKHKELSEKHRKHHKRRKSHHGEEERKKGGDSDSDAEERRNRKYDRRSDGKRKEKKRDHDGEEEGSDRNGHAPKEIVDEDRYRYDPEERESRRDSKSRHEIDSQKATRAKYDTEEIYYEDRDRHGVVGKDRSGRLSRRHGPDDERSDTRHQDMDEKRNTVHAYEAEAEEKRKEHRHRHGSEERRDRRHGSDEKRKERRHSHGKRKKHRDHDDSGGDGDSDEKRSHRKTRRQLKEKEKPSLQGLETPNGEIRVDSVPEKLHEGGDQLHLDTPMTSAVKEPPSSSIDVPDDIRAKVRAMLAGI
ncbi:hypothetical protein R1sor_024314 [Riccia sorocarpa]|uniref:SURP motif domain-containing protein n=1 Tax=Riccia sorocarpa TaxID=122646 RepID=A0ABD3GQB5_9MARC